MGWPEKTFFLLFFNSQGKKEFRNIKKENRQGFSFPLHPPPHPLHFPKVFSSPPTRIPRNTLIHTHTDTKKKELKPHFSLGQIISASSPVEGGSFRKNSCCWIVVWGVGIERRLYYDEPLSLFTQVNSRQVAELLLSTLSLLKNVTLHYHLRLSNRNENLQKGNSANQKNKQKEKKTLFSKRYWPPLGTFLSSKQIRKSPLVLEKYKMLLSSSPCNAKSPRVTWG